MSAMLALLLFFSGRDASHSVLVLRNFRAAEKQKKIR
jgi:hypothetical protein